MNRIPESQVTPVLHEETRVQIEKWSICEANRIHECVNEVAAVFQHVAFYHHRQGEQEHMDGNDTGGRSSVTFNKEVHRREQSHEYADYENLLHEYHLFAENRVICLTGAVEPILGVAGANAAVRIFPAGYS
jgi:hypothetical protein